LVKESLLGSLKKSELQGTPATVKEEEVELQAVSRVRETFFTGNGAQLQKSDLETFTRSNSRART
jgi:hypothetical protein